MLLQQAMAAGKASVAPAVGGIPDLVEDGVTGRHNAELVLQPFIDSLAPRRRPLKIAVLLYGAGSSNKITQSILEMVRAGLPDLALDVTVPPNGYETDLLQKLNIENLGTAADSQSVRFHLEISPDVELPLERARMMR